MPLLHMQMLFSAQLLSNARLLRVHTPTCWPTLRYLHGQVSAPTVHRLVLRELLNPRQWRAPEDRKFHLDAEQINELCDAAERIFKDEPSVLRLRGEGLVFHGIHILQDSIYTCSSNAGPV